MGKDGTMHATLPVAFNSDNKMCIKQQMMVYYFTVSLYSWNVWWKTSYSHITQICSKCASVKCKLFFFAILNSDIFITSNHATLQHAEIQHSYGEK